MKFTEMNFREYYHQILAFEVDDLTDQFKEQVDVDYEDCFMACGNYVDERGNLKFYVLGIGPAFDDCHKICPQGVFREYFGDELSEYECKVVSMDDEVEVFSQIYQDARETGPSDLLETREIEMIDNLRHPFLPDYVSCVIYKDRKFEEKFVALVRTDHVFLEGYDEDEEEPLTLVSSVMMDRFVLVGLPKIDFEDDLDAMINKLVGALDLGDNVNVIIKEEQE